MLDKLGQGFRALVLVRAQTDGHGVGLRFFVAHDQHVRDLLHLGVAYLGVHALAAHVYLAANARGLEFGQHLLGVLVVPVGDGNDHGLHRCQPDWEGSGKVLDQHGHEALRRTRHGAVNDHRAMGMAVLADVLQLEVLRLNKVELHRRALPVAAQGIPDHEVRFGTVEGRLADHLRAFDALVLDRLAQCFLGPVPDLIAAYVLLFLLRITQRKRDPVVRQAVRLKNLQRQVNGTVELFLNLVRAQEDMGVVLRQTAHACQARERACLLIAVERRELGVAHWHLAIAVRLRLEERDVMRAVHRLQNISIVLRLLLFAHHDREHILAIVKPVLGRFIQAHAAQVRRPDMLVAVTFLRLAHIRFHLVAQRLAVGQEHRHAARQILVHHEELEFASQLAVIALGCLFQPPEILLHLLLRDPRRAIDALEHRALLVAAPVRARDLHQLKGTNLPRILHVRTTTEVQERVLLVDANFSIRQVLNQLNLIGLSFDLEVLQGLLARPAIALEKIFSGDNLAHTLLNIGQIFGRQRARKIEIIVEPILNRGPDREFRVRKNFLHSLGHHMGRGVSHTLNWRIV